MVGATLNEEGFLVDTKILLLQHNQHIYLLTFQSLSETFIRRSLFNSSSVLAMIVMRRGKKSVVRVAQRVAPLVPVQGLPSFSNMYCLFDPPSTFVGFSVQNSGGWPINHVVVM